jgi:hypothetical protein
MLAKVKALSYKSLTGSDAAANGDKQMNIKATIEIDVKILKALVNNDLDTSQRQAIMNEIWKIAELKGYCDARGNPTKKANE